MAGQTPREQAPSAALPELRARLKGSLALPGEPGYELAQPWNRAVTVSPAAVIAAADTDDLAETLRFAAAHRFRVTVQTTGHGAVPVGDDVLLVHTVRFDECTIDPERRVAGVGAGVRWQRVLDATGPHGLTPVAGAATSVGVVGYLSGGGIGPLAATLGVSADYVRALDVVTGDGQPRRVTPTEHPDLFWGLRGGKSTLGIITAVEIDLLPLTTVYGGALYYDGEDTAAVLRAWTAWSAALPEQATTSVALLQLPALPFIPPPLAGRASIAVRYASIADPARAEELLAPMRAVATPVLDAVGELPCAEISRIHADPQEPSAAREGHTLLAGLPSTAVDAVLAVAGPGSGSPLLMVELRRLGGAVSRVPRHASAVSHRDAGYALTAIELFDPSHQPGAATHIDQVIAAVETWSTGGRLANFAATADPAGIARAYDRETFDRLRTLARRYDPAGVLANGQCAR